MLEQFELEVGFDWPEGIYEFSVVDLDIRDASFDDGTSGKYMVVKVEDHASENESDALLSAPLPKPGSTLKPTSKLGVLLGQFGLTISDGDKVSAADIDNAMSGKSFKAKVYRDETGFSKIDPKSILARS